jgi:hypothetical protein
MRTSSALQLEIPGLGTETVQETQQTDFLTSGDSQPPMANTATTFSPLSAPSLITYASAYAATSRLLGRLNTTMVKKEEMENLLNERQALLDKKFDGTMTRRDENRLEYVRWSLGRIQDARSGPSLDALESMVGTYEGFLAGMRNFESQLNDAVKTHKENNRNASRRVNKRRR